MIAIGLAAWLVLGAALFAAGLLAAVVRRDRAGVLVGLLFMLAATTVAMAALVRHAVLPPPALATLLVILVLGSILVLVIETVSAGKEES